MTNYETVDFYTDTSLLDDPHAYFDFLRSKGPVTRLPYRNVIAVTGYDETVQVMRDTEHFSSINAVTGPIPGLPFEPEGDDITEQLEAARSKIAFADQVVTEQCTFENLLVNSGLWGTRYKTNTHTHTCRYR